MSFILLVFVVLGLCVLLAILFEVRKIRDESEGQTRLLIHIREHLDNGHSFSTLEAIRRYLEETQRNLLARMGNGKPPWEDPR